MENQEPSNFSRQQTTINVQVPSVDSIASRRPLIPASFALAIIFFAFTFCDFQCGGQKIASVTGYNLVTGTEVKGPSLMGGESKGEKVPSNMFAILALGAAIIGLGAFLIREKREALVGTGAGLIGFGSLLIMQFVIKNQIEKQGQGVISVTFQFGYWGALIALGIAGLVSYLRMRQSHNVVIDFAPPQPQQQVVTATVTAESVDIPTQAQISSYSQTIDGFDMGEWFARNIKLVIGGVASILVLFCVYWFFIKHDPGKDAKKAVAAECDCSEKYNEELIKAKEEFINSFSSNSFKKRQEARAKLEEIHNPILSSYSTCISQAHAKETELRNRYSTKPEELNTFDVVRSAQAGNCNPSNQTRLSSLTTDIENKILTIKDPEPDIEKIKNDLIGKSIPGWNFAYLNEFTSADITNTTKGGDVRIEYQLQLKLHDAGTNSDHDCEIIAVYLQGYEGWQFDNVKMLSITYTNIAPVNQWQKIGLLSNCRFTINDQGHNYWAFDGGYVRKKYMGGPNEPAFTLTTNDVYIMSRESEPVPLIFKYTPNN